MAVYKCKMCGGALDVTEGNKVITCDFCGTTQTVHSFDDEKKVNLFTRANELRFRHEFDKASGIYESIVAEFPQEAEAYWGLLLCKYGIDYVDDPATGKKIPTCNRTSFDSILKDPDYENILKYADVVSKEVYEEEAKKLENIRKEIIKVSSQQDPYDIFICFKDTDDNKERTEDSVLAEKIYNELEPLGYRIFFSRITLEDKMGTQFEPYIFSALYSSKLLIHVTKSLKYSRAPWVVNEWSRFLDMAKEDKSKNAFICYEGIDPEKLPEEINGLQATNMAKLGAFLDVRRFIIKYFADLKKKNAEAEKEPDDDLQNDYKLLIRKGFRFLETGDLEKANDFFDQSIGVVDKCGEGYLGQLLVENELQSIDEVKGISDITFLDEDLFKNAKKYASKEFAKTILEIEYAITNNNHKEHYESYKEQIENSNSPELVYKSIKLLSDYIDKSIENNEANGTKIDLFDGEVELTYKGAIRLANLLLDEADTPEEMYKIDYALSMLDTEEIKNYCDTSELVSKLTERKRELIKVYDDWCISKLEMDLPQGGIEFEEKFANLKDVIWKYRENMLVFASFTSKDDVVIGEYSRIQEGFINWVKTNAKSVFESVPVDKFYINSVLTTLKGLGDEFNFLDEDLQDLESKINLIDSKNHKVKVRNGLIATGVFIAVLGVLIALTFLFFDLW